MGKKLSAKVSPKKCENPISRIDGIPFDGRIALNDKSSILPSALRAGRAPRKENAAVLAAELAGRIVEEVSPTCYIMDIGRPKIPVGLARESVRRGRCRRVWPDEAGVDPILQKQEGVRRWFAREYYEKR